MKQRVLKVMKPIVILLTVGFIYIIVHEWTGFSIPCPIYTVTGLLCPGCGISRAIFHLLHFRFYEALSSNVVVVCLMPSFVLGAAVHLYRYIRYGKTSFTKAENIVMIVMIVLLLMFAVVRNIYPMDILVP